jgi:hypothetical protein
MWVYHSHLFCQVILEVQELVPSLRNLLALNVLNADIIEKLKELRKY